MGVLRSRVFGLFLAVCLGVGALAANAWADCATYVSSGANDPPASGYLWGEQEVTETRTYSIGGKAGTATVSAEGSGTYTVSVSFSVGYYRMDDGSIERLDCRTYTRYTG